MTVTSKLSLDLDLYEKVVMFNALLDQTYLETIIEHVKPSYFKDKDIKKVFSVLSSFYEQYQKVPNTTELKAHLVSEEDKQSLKNVVLSFNSIDQKYDKDVLISNTERFLKEKAVLSTVLSTSIDVNSGEIDSTAILKNFEKACGISLIDNLGFDYFENIDEHIVELQKTFKTISSGWKWLDKHLAGGFQAEGKALYVFFGQTNVGKSIFLGQMATNILEQGKTVVLISLEMGEQVYAKRISSSLSRIPSNDLTKHIDPLKSKINQYKLKNKDSKLIIKEFPPKGVTVLGIKNYLEKLVKNGIKPDVVILDYLNLIAPAKNGQNSYEAIKEISEGIRALSYKFECSFISATQQNRCLSINTLCKLRDKNGTCSDTEIKNLKIGDEILGSDGYVTVRYVYPIEKQKVFKIKTESGKEIICSSRHIFPTFNGNVKSIDTGLSIGDLLISRATQKNI